MTPNDEIISPNGYKEGDPSSVPDVNVHLEKDGVTSPVGSSQLDHIIEDKVDYFFEIKWRAKWKDVFNKWKYWLGGVGQTLLLIITWTLRGMVE